MQVKLSKPFARNSAADEYDVRQMKKALNRLGYYHPYKKIGMTNIPDGRVFEALKSFQKEQGLKSTGKAKPDDKTLMILNAEIAKNPDGYYIWRTAGDDKVRQSHALLEGTIRSWNQSPDPCEDYNCRCWAEPVSDEIQKEELKPPNISGTNIPDHGMPEQGDQLHPAYDQHSEFYKADPEIIKMPPIVDPGILLPYDDKNPGFIKRPGKQDI